MNHRNLSKKRHAFRSADGYVVSIPKSGRTWLHFLIQYYHCTKHKIPFSLYPDLTVDDGIPDIMYTHDLWEHRSANKILERLKGKHLIPEDCRATKTILLLTRDLRDVMVSLHFQVTKRDRSFSGTLSEMFDHPVLGAESMVDILNLWWDEWHTSDRFLHATYEGLKVSPMQELTRILVHFGETDPDADTVAKALEFASFENMQRMEKGDAVSDKILRPADKNDPESFKVRRGVQGGYSDYLSDQDVAVVETAMRRLKFQSTVPAP